MSKHLVRIVAVISCLFILFSPSMHGRDVRYKLEKGKTYRYSISFSTTTNGQGGGQEFKITSSTEIGISLKVEEAVNHGYTSLLTIDRFTVRINFPLMGYDDSTVTVKEYVGKRIRIAMTDFGKTTAVDPLDPIPPTAVQSFIGLGPAEMFKRFFFELPEKEIDVNSTWDKNVPDTTTRNDMKVVVKQDMDFKVASEEKIGGRDCFKIVYTGKGSFTGEGNQRGMKIAVGGTSKSDGITFFAPGEGLFISTDYTTDNNIGVTLEGGQTAVQTMLTSVSAQIKLIE
jgi:hypothetical protein